MWILLECSHIGGRKLSETIKQQCQRPKWKIGKEATRLLSNPEDSRLAMWISYGPGIPQVMKVLETPGRV